ncbi:MAG TPA: GntR family transcriptional regulator [Edaphobacter sp.]|nr:GntR family transcriptional regulator [Edaphobacter sp.]
MEKVEHRLNGKTPIASIDCRINRHSFVPFYQQIKNYLLDRIQLGQLSNGDLIPSEAQLSGALSVSRGTVRQALYELRVEGYVVREKGRGTFVKRPVTNEPSTSREAAFQANQ